MKLLFFMALSLTALPAMAEILSCTTAENGYYDVQKFRIIDQKQIVILGDKDASQTTCFRKFNFLDCKLTTPQQRNYSLRLDLYTLRAEIAHASGHAYPVICKTSPF